MRSMLTATLAVLTLVLTASAASAAGDAATPKSSSWAHGGPFGTFDRASVQRGFQVYREVCASCHSLRFIAFRNLLEIGLNEEEAKAVAAEYEVTDGPNADGDMYDRAGKLSDYFPSPFANANAARASNNGAFPPDLSLIVKGRTGHEDYIYSILTGYADPPAGFQLGDGMNYNAFFAGGQIAMAAPLSEDVVEYADGTSATVEQMSRDVTSFLAWAGDPHMEARKRMGVKVVLFLVVFAGLMYAVKRKVWADLH